MSFWLYAAVWFLLAFLAGSIPFGWIIARAGGVDITKHGSGNIGMTNVWRIMGWKPGVACLLLDCAKGLLPVVILGYCINAMPTGFVPAGWDAGLKMLVALAAVLGHTFTPWLKFKGGKGMATGMGVIIGLYQVWVIPVLAIFGLVVLTTRFVSVGSLMAALFLFLFTVSIDSIRPFWPFSLLALFLVVWTHRTNIERLLAGEENQVGRRKPSEAEPDDKPAEEPADPDDAS